MDLRQLETFVHVAELGSFTRASIVLQAAQPALSKQIRRLEVELGQTLFSRHGRGIVLTEEGALLLEHARGIIEQVARARHALGAIKDTPQGKVVIATPAVTGKVMTSGIITTFRQRFPQASLEIIEGKSRFITELLLSGRIDIAILYDPPASPLLEITPLMSHELSLFSLAGKTLAEMAAHWGVTPVEAYMRTIRETAAEVDTGQSMEDIIGTSMSEDDVSWFVAHPEIAFCSDGALHGSHPRGAGAFPRILGHYVREAKVLPLPEAIRKMTSLPASRLGLKDRGRIAPGYVADLVLFDPATVIDQSTIQHPEAPPLGIPAVMVSGEWVIRDGAVTGKRPGKALQGPGYRAAR